MREKALSLFNVYEDEINLLIWTTLLLFLVRSSGIILNNFAETAFLKRYGVEYLPIVNMINSIATFVITGFLAAAMGKVAGGRLLSYVFIFCGITVVIIRLIIPMGFDIVYPVLFMLKSQFELLQALLFWNLANDLFNTRQSKRLFSLLTAGGVIGLILGSFGTPYFARLFALDNLLYLYMGTTFLGAILVELMARSYPTLVFSKETNAQKRNKKSIVEEFKTIIPLIKKSTLLKIVLVLTFMPNVIVPIMNYQFNFAINDQFASEAGMIEFFGYFRGGLNIVSLFILLFVGKIYGKWGLPVALMFHPFNYIIALFAFLFRFDIFSAMYAKMSINIIRTTINVPTKGVLMGLFPASYRSMVRSFLKGTVVRAALFLGSGLILVSENYFHPRYLTIVALPFLIAWMAAPVILKYKYAVILKDLVANNLLDLKRLEPEELVQVFKEEKALEELKKSYLSAKGDDAVWYAKLLKNFSRKNFNSIILENIDDQDEKTKIALIKMLTSQAFQTSTGKIIHLLDPDKAKLTIAILKLGVKYGFEDIKDVDLTAYENNENPVVRGFAIGCMYLNNPVEYKKIIDKELLSKDLERRKTGIISAGLTGQKEYINDLEKILSEEKKESVIPDVIIALSRLKAQDLNDKLIPFLFSGSEKIRHAAADAIEINDETVLSKTVLLLGDSSKTIRELVKDKIKESKYENNKLLVKSLALPSTRIRKELFELLETLDIKEIDVFLFAKEQLDNCYNYLSMSQNLENRPESKLRNLVMEHLIEKKELGLENIIRVLSINDQTGRMKTAWLGIFSLDTRQRANSIELLSDILDKKLFNAMLPLLESPSLSVALAAGKKVSKIPRFDSQGKDVFSHLLASEDWVDNLMGLGLAREEPSLLEGHDMLEEIKNSDNHIILKEVQMILKKKDQETNDDRIDSTDISLADKILLLKEVEIFSGLTASELAAIAAITKELDYPEGKAVIEQGDVGETVFLIIDGNVDVIMEQPDGKEIVMDKIESGGAFGEMALIDNAPRSATIKTVSESRFIILHKQEFKEIVMEHPGIALQICSVFSSRIRHLHKGFNEKSKCSEIRRKP
jgi:HEAT repeat protein